MNLSNLSLEFLVLQLLNGLSLSMLLFLLAAGLSLIFGLMNVINLAHGAFYLLGAYFGFSLLNWTNSFWLAFLLAPLGVGLVGLVTEWGLLRWLYQRDHLNQVILTFGLAYVLADVMRWIWGGDPKSLPAPEPFNGFVQILGRQFPTYRLFVIGFSLLLALFLWLLLEKTRLGAIIRAGVSDQEMARGLGINVGFTFTLIFSFGVALAGLAGVIAGPYQSFGPGVDFDTLILALIVVVIGGLGTLSGAFCGAIVLGLADTFGKVFFPELAQFVIYAVMAGVLLVRPTGLFSRSPV
ncbi:MAG: branched-chain amino acid ABC transporter permease [Chloroflexi bacterium]|nr:branched-chain amino acid ABC transporter permease [Chloroflexota bacterium]